VKTEKERDQVRSTNIIWIFLLATQAQDNDSGMVKILRSSIQVLGQKSWMSHTCKFGKCCSSSKFSNCRSAK